MDPILAIASAHKLAVIEDACQALGARYEGKRAGSMGDAGCFSFYPGENLGAYGEGGAVVTNKAELDKKIRLLRDWGAPQRYHHELKGDNYRLEGSLPMFPELTDEQVATVSSAVRDAG